METTDQAQYLGIIAKPLSVKLLQTVGLTASGILMGHATALSYLTMPSLLSAGRDPDTVLRGWRVCRERGVTVGRVLILTGAGVWGYMAWREPTIHTPAFRFYALAALLPPLSIPYALVIHAPVIKELMKRAHSPGASVTASAPDATFQVESTTWKSYFGAAAPANKDLTAHQLVDKWAILNLGRAALFIAGTACAAWAIVNEDLSFFELF